MKKLSTLLATLILISASFIFFSCDKDDDAAWPPANYLTVGDKTQEIRSVFVSEKWCIIVPSIVTDNLNSKPKEYIYFKVTKIDSDPINTSLYRNGAYVCDDMGRTDTYNYRCHVRTDDYRFALDLDMKIFSMSGIPTSEIIKIKAHYIGKYIKVTQPIKWADDLYN